jgi:Cu2+-exporting ATPase
VARTIVEAGLSDYYQYRTESAARADPDVVPDIVRRLGLYDHPDVQRSFVRASGEYREASLILEDIRCAACLWLNEQHLRRLPGVVDVRMDYASQRARVVWDPAHVRLSDILRAVTEIGYVAHPYDPSHRERLLRDQRRRDLARILFAAVVGMPVMQFTLATYLIGAPPTGPLELWEVIGRWTTLAASTAVLAYSGQDFFVGAWRDFRAGRLGMDVPIVLGLVTAWLGSAAATVLERGDYYADSITMFVLFVLLARRYEMRGREAAANAMDRLARVVPQTARRLGPEGDAEEVAAVDLAPGDRLRVLPGESLPADGVVREGASSFDESLLTGESLPVPKGPGETVIAGTCNRDQPVVVEVTRVGEASTVGEVRRLLDHGLQSRPRYAQLAERVAEWFVPVVLLVAVLTALAWLRVDPFEALRNTVSVLIVTCPCALALATPVAVAVTTGRLADGGVLALRLEALEALAQADLGAFDKTGTLTLGELGVVSARALGGVDPAHALELAAALEAGSEHPVAQAFRRAAGPSRRTVLARVNEPGAGVSGEIDGVRWRIGRADWAAPAAGAAVAAEVERVERLGRRAVVLADGRGALVVYGLEDRARPGAPAMLAALAAAGVRRFAVVSGDSTRTTREVAARLGIDEALGDLRPQDKLAWVRGRQAEGHGVLMVGDGINDAPTLAAADVSISFGDATDLAQRSSDFVVLRKDLGAVAFARRLARKARTVIRQNLLWAAAYNLLAVPAAALGMVPPWAAALGMSASSLLVVANAMRLTRARVDETSAEGLRDKHPTGLPRAPG